MHNFYFKNTIQIDNSNIRTILDLQKPRLALFSNFLSIEECDQLIELSKDKLQRSHVISHVGEGTIEDEARTSFGMFFKRQSNPLVTVIENRISTLLNLPPENGEGIQILNYKINNEYKPHHDYFKPNDQGEIIYLNRGGQRIVTFIMYLNDVEQGGGTIFPSLGVEFKPIKGNALFFYYQLENGEPDIYTLHGGSPVIAGEKWIATKWIREREFI